VLSLAGQVLPKRYERIRRLHLAIADDSPDERVHDVRLQAKKLRYLLEFFGALYPPEGAGRLIKRLKKLQNTLGEFNDLAVQRESLRNYVGRKPSDERNYAGLMLAVGSLLGILHRQHQDVRRRVFRQLTSFTGDDTRELVEEVFKGGRRAA
jgi:CHAD domain-containing protein